MSLNELIADIVGELGLNLNTAIKNKLWNDIQKIMISVAECSKNQKPLLFLQNCSPIVIEAIALSDNKENLGEILESLCVDTCQWTYANAALSSVVLFHLLEEGCEQRAESAIWKDISKLKDRLGKEISEILRRSVN